MKITELEKHDYDGDSGDVGHVTILGVEPEDRNEFCRKFKIECTYIKNDGSHHPDDKDEYFVLNWNVHNHLTSYLIKKIEKHLKAKFTYTEVIDGYRMNLKQLEDKTIFNAFFSCQ